MSLDTWALAVSVASILVSGLSLYVAFAREIPWLDRMAEAWQRKRNRKHNRKMKCLD